jgi:hypothetical protein
MIFAPGTTAPVWSVTVPVICAVWPNALAVRATIKAASTQEFFIEGSFLFVVCGEGAEIEIVRGEVAAMEGSFQDLNTDYGTQIEIRTAPHSVTTFWYRSNPSIR